MKELEKREPDEPDDIWEVRILFRPQERYFGGFLKKDRFVVTNMRLRDDLSGPIWTATKKKTADIWGNLFTTSPRFHGICFADYVTDGVDLG